MEWLEGGSNLKSHLVSICGIWSTSQVDCTWALVSTDWGPNTAATPSCKRLQTKCQNDIRLGFNMIQFEK
jgi:hypothetical protein